MPPRAASGLGQRLVEVFHVECASSGWAGCGKVLRIEWDGEPFLSPACLLCMCLLPPTPQNKTNQNRVSLCSPACPGLSL